MNALLILASILLAWDDPNNPVGTVAGYNVYRVEHLGTGEVIRHRVNAELIPWVADGESTPSLLIHGVLPLQEYRGTAVGFKPEEGPLNESELSDDFYTVPLPPVAVRWRIQTDTPPALP